MMTTMVVLMTSFRDGQVTFLSSARDVLQERPEPLIPSHFFFMLPHVLPEVSAFGPTGEDPGVGSESNGR